MADANFWRDLADQFRNLPNAEWVQAIWQQDEHSKDGQWKILFPEDEQAIRFEALVMRAVLVVDPTCADPLATWLHGMWQYYRSLKSRSSGAEVELKDRTVLQD